MGWGYDKTYVAGNDTVLHPGALAATEKLDMTGEDDAIWHLCAWNFFCLHHRTIPRVGWFDENFYPAYMEDCDYRWRCHLAGMHRYMVPTGEESSPGKPYLTPGIPATPEVKVDHKGSLTVKSNAKYAKHSKVTHGRMGRTYYKNKWGGMPNGEKFKIPFNGARGGEGIGWFPDPGELIARRDWDKHTEKVRGILKNKK